MKNLHIIMPMAGEGNRFKDKGYDVPKPIIIFEGKELYRHALDSIYESSFIKHLKDLKIKHTFIVRQEFIDNFRINERIKNLYPEANIIAVQKTTRGSLDTALLAEPYIDKENDNILLIDSDLEFRCQDYYDELTYRFENKYDKGMPLLLSFYSQDPKYSYAECIVKDNRYYAIKTAEKQVISTHALSGCYYFGNAKMFIEYGKELIKDFESGKIKDKECYVSLLYNYYINNTGYDIMLCDFDIHKDHFYSYGTPEELTHYLTTKKNIWDK